MGSSGVQPGRYQLRAQGSVCGPWQPLCLLSVCQLPPTLCPDQITQRWNLLRNSILQKSTNLTRYQRLEQRVVLCHIDVSGGGWGWGHTNKNMALVGPH